MRQIWASDPQFNAITTHLVLVNCILLGYNAASSSNFLPTFRGRVSVPSSKVYRLYFHVTYQKDKRRSLELSSCSPKYCASYFCHNFLFLLIFPYFLRLSFFFSLSVFKGLSQTGCIGFWTNNMERTSFNDLLLLFRAANPSVSWFLQELISTHSY